MKQIIITMSVMALAFTSCQKHPVQSNNNDNDLPAEVTQYYHGQMVTTEDQVPGYSTANVYAL